MCVFVFEYVSVCECLYRLGEGIGFFVVKVFCDLIYIGVGNCFTKE